MFLPFLYTVSRPSNQSAGIYDLAEKPQQWRAYAFPFFFLKKNQKMKTRITRQQQKSTGGQSENAPPSPSFFILLSTALVLFFSLTFIVRIHQQQPSLGIKQPLSNTVFFLFVSPLCCSFTAKFLSSSTFHDTMSSPPSSLLLSVLFFTRLFCFVLLLLIK